MIIRKPKRYIVDELGNKFRFSLHNHLALRFGRIKVQRVEPWHGPFWKTTSDWFFDTTDGYFPPDEWYEEEEDDNLSEAG